MLVKKAPAGRLTGVTTGTPAGSLRLPRTGCSPPRMSRIRMISGGLGEERHLIAPLCVIRRNSVVPFHGASIIPYLRQETSEFSCAASRTTLTPAADTVAKNAGGIS